MISVSDHYRKFDPSEGDWIRGRSSAKNPSVYFLPVIFLAWLLLFLPTSCEAQSPETVKQGRKKSVKQVDFETLALEAISRAGVMADEAVVESSGLALSSRPNAFWTINDSGHAPECYLLNEEGKKLGRAKLTSAKNRDWEALASYVDGDRHWIIVADVGDNQRLQNRYQLYYFLDTTNAASANPKKAKYREVNSLRIDFAYSDDPSGNGAFVSNNCEAIAVDPTNGDVWFIEKVYLNRDRSVKPGVNILRSPKKQLDAFAKNQTARQASAKPHDVKTPFLIAERAATFPVRNVTGMSFSPDGNKLIVRNYLNAHLYVRDSKDSWLETVKNQKPTVVAMPFQSQGEAICFATDSTSIIATSEGKRQPIWKVDLSVYLKQIQKTSNAKPETGSPSK